MKFDGESAPFRVVFCDGNRKINLGIVEVDPSLNFKRLLSLLCQMTGISQHQFSVFLADEASDRKIPLTAKVNLAAVSRDSRAYYFLVKRSRRSKKSPTNKRLPEKVMLLRRDGAAAAAGGVGATLFSEFRPTLAAVPPILDRFEFGRRMRNLRMEREAFLASMEINVESLRRETPNGNGGGDGGAVCEECLKAKAKATGIDAGFHLCVDDEVIVAFRSTVGPVSRPARNSDEDCH